MNTVASAIFPVTSGPVSPPCRINTLIPDDRLERKLGILAQSARYDVSCVSSGVSGAALRHAALGAPARSGICHSWTADGRCVSLLKVLLSNACVYDCAYCANRCSANVPRATFKVEELVSLTWEFYRRNYIEGLFLSSAIWSTPDRTMEAMVRVAEKLRYGHGFGGYIHLKVIPGASLEWIVRAGRVADRLSINIELPSERSLGMLCPQKSRAAILTPMLRIRDTLVEFAEDRGKGFRHVPRFAPAGQSTQLVVGATPEGDDTILRLSDALYRKVGLRRVFYSAYVPVGDDRRIPVLAPPEKLREHRLYQADWLLRFYGFTVEEIAPNEGEKLDARFDPKTAWALKHPEYFPVDVNRDDRERLLQVPGLGVRNVNRILQARHFGSIDAAALRR
ncbi:MAG TPA: putative DNA modification/repair radical SAM protein, partial [Candidatus Hydrogenedentes bacterium]|nr:putative DNA modification/repair radical SAM protein [Candidatus Hydrogenedentota bacterium]